MNFKQLRFNLNTIIHGVIHVLYGTDFMSKLKIQVYKYVFSQNKQEGKLCYIPAAINTQKFVFVLSSCQFLQ